MGGKDTEAQAEAVAGAVAAAASAAETVQSVSRLYLHIGETIRLIKITGNFAAFRYQIKPSRRKSGKGIERVRGKFLHLKA